MILIARRSLKRIRYLLLVAFTILFLDFVLSRQSSYPLLDSTNNAEDLKAIRSVYIASSQWNSGTLLEKHWIPSLLQVVSELKSANISVFVSIYENGSWDSTKTLLQQLQQTLEARGVNNQITIDSTSHEQIVSQNTSAYGWLRTAYGEEKRRIPYLASVRNEALKPLSALAKSGTRFDKVVYINDVVFSAADIITLLGTRDGQYAAACALDFLNPPGNWVDAKTRGTHPRGVYDDFATRDSSGNPLRSHLYPYFGSKVSKAAIMSGRNVPVQSCWNGAVAFDAAPFQSDEDPLRFRGIPDSLAQYHVEASECCIIHYDNPLSSSLGVWINPAVRVGYSADAYKAISATPVNGLKSDWPTGSELRWGYWSSKWLWWIRDPGSPVKTWYRVRKWQQSFPDVAEPGLACASDLAMVLTSNGWAHRGAQFE